MSDYAPDQATARADLCRFLSACYYEPTEEFAEEKMFDSMLTAAQRGHPELVEQVRKLGQAFAEHELQTLMVDYARLFLGPTRALTQPYESSWRNSSSQSDEDPHLALLEMYAQGALDIDAQFMELPDHVAVELEFLYLLIFASKQAREAGQLDECAAAQALQARFLVEHLGVWIPAFSAAVADAAETPFYRELAVLTEQLVAWHLATGRPE